MGRGAGATNVVVRATVGVTALFLFCNQLTAATGDIVFPILKHPFFSSRNACHHTVVSSSEFILMKEFQRKICRGIYFQVANNRSHVG